MGQEESTVVDESTPPQSLSERTLSAVADYIESGRVRRIVVLTGAGISTAAGIPDFRSPKTGLYNNLARLNLPYAEAVFDISYFRQHPEPFYVLAQELYPGKFSPTISHAFIALLAEKGLLQMLFTQNIDCLERAAGVPADKIVEAHGSFATQRCIECQTVFPDDKMRDHVFDGKVPHCEDKRCNGTVKPDIVFFGEQLPKIFSQQSHQTTMADLVLILGTSLTVYPFAGLPDMTRDGKPRVLFNMERVGNIGTRSDDVIQLGSCDDGIRKLADLLGWREELETLWKGVVGEKEAKRQSRSQEKQEHDVEDEVDKLTEGIKAALNFDDESDTEENVDGPTSASKENVKKVGDTDENDGSEKDDSKALDLQSDAVNEVKNTTMTSTWTPEPSAAKTNPKEGESQPKTSDDALPTSIDAGKKSEKDEAVL